MEKTNPLRNTAQSLTSFIQELPAGDLTSSSEQTILDGLHQITLMANEAECKQSWAHNEIQQLIDKVWSSAESIGNKQKVAMPVKDFMDMKINILNIAITLGYSKPNEIGWAYTIPPEFHK